MVMWQFFLFALVSIIATLYIFKDRKEKVVRSTDRLVEKHDIEDLFGSDLVDISTNKYAR